MHSLAQVSKEILSRISPRLLTSLEFHHIFGRWINWRHPSDLNEKINWLKFFSDTSLWTQCADKYSVRKYVEDCGYANSLVQLYGKWDSSKEIDWAKLPNQFVMKVNNGSGDILVCKNKAELDVQKASSRFDALMKKRFSNYNAEPHYMAMTPCIIAEELLDTTKQPIETDTLIDYKIWCFDGSPKYVWACYNRHKESVEVATYDLDWNRHDEKSVFTSHYKKALKTLPRPVSLQDMLMMAAKLSEGIPQVRVDLYEIGGKPYFGEMTFTSAGGFNNFYTQDFLDELGGYVRLDLAPKK